MTLPEIVLPKITLPFEMPILLHPIVDHFLIALPVVILLLELMNLIMKKKAVGGVSFFLIVLTVLAAAGAYLTGLTDGKEAYPALADAAKTALSEHKLLGTYLLLGSGVLLLLKLLAMTGNKILKGLYVLALIAFVAVLFKQGKEGGELVYEHGLNVEQVKTLDDEIFDLKEELEDALAAAKKTVPIAVTPAAKEVTKPTVVTPSTEVPQTAPVTTPSVVTPTPSTSPLEETGVETVNTAASAVVETAKKAEVLVPAQTIPSVQ